MKERLEEPWSEGAGEPPPVDLGRLLEVVDLTYQAIDSPQRLGTLLAAVAAAVGASSALLVACGGGERRLLADGHVEAWRASGALAIANGQAADPGTRTVPLGGGLELVLDRADFPPAEQMLLYRLIPHLARAFRLAERLAAVERGTLHSAALERLPTGVALLDDHGQILFLNRSARRLLASDLPLGVVESRLVPRHPVSRALLETLIERVAAPATTNRRRPGGRVRIAAPDGAAVDLVVVPFDGRIDGAPASCAVFLSREGDRVSIEQRFAEVYDLNPAEVRVAIHLVEGCPSAPTPEGSTSETDQAAVRSLYQKLGSTRQRDLIWLLLRPPGAIFQAAGAEPRAF